ncbi:MULTISPECIES: 30S ribosomal protein S6 [unclassified Nitratiruptor]|uniref:Small ribosomal subunit protein bS6 n=1 Tax=Nitratiruptor sp. (strain SB155-2) TaxID=387092 RepID=RS6_NITSB|nr:MULTISPECIES: 30S ribosomal protein S6 [unclassified Nitratiruptor]A6Q464.1 RecName: Full=Small ribosomal subunit protein bS6; AltName: Full=30S ribosomal protein S6 [Nitratiruptor sp. SB155-2]BAF70273.1 30S ribosomal protein S6 [Nitratiruptor sp. SB155-2]BCD60114.1 small subunit ribosomal protein S6 [Nitratiruptor sp. YY08-10]BCD64397.1 small subunit ribosomal protein S6 [Nitratiruptor sp. YY08-14]
MRHYETLFVLKPTLTDEESKAKFEFIKEVIQNNGGEIVATEDLGVRKLAYPIQKFERGHYYIIYFTAPSHTVLELERIYRITEDVIRFLTIKYETKKDISAWEKMVERAKKLSGQTNSEAKEEANENV